MNYASLMFGTVFGLFGCITLFISIRDLLRAAKSSNWPLVHGRVLESRILTPVGRYGTSYDAAVRFGYTIGEREYSSDRIAFFRIDDSRAEAEQTVARYPLGSNVEVRVSPQDPALGVLEPGLRWHSYMSLLMPVACLGIGTVLLLRALL